VAKTAGYVLIPARRARGGRPAACEGVGVRRKPQGRAGGRLERDPPNFCPENPGCADAMIRRVTP
jgi:hypothetical protein